MPFGEYLRRQEAARYLGVSTRTISEFQKKRLIPYVRLARKCVRFQRSALDRAMERLVVQSVGSESPTNTVAP